MSARVEELDKLLIASSNEIENQKNDLKILEIEKNKPAAESQGPPSFPLKSFAATENLVRLSL